MRRFICWLLGHRFPMRLPSHMSQAGRIDAICELYNHNMIPKDEAKAMLEWPHPSCNDCLRGCGIRRP